MALKSLGTNANNSLSAMKVGLHTSSGGMTTPNIAVINNHIADDLVNGNPVIPQSFHWFGPGGLTKAGTPTSEGGSLLFIPNRGVLKVLYGDIVAYDSSTGWPILVSANALANGPWTFA
jgi:hypothetical protein